MVTRIASLPLAMTAQSFIAELREKGKKSKSDNLRYFHNNDGKTKSLGPRFGEIFALAKKYTSLSINEIEKLLVSEFYEARMGAVSIMDFQARDKKISQAHRKALYDLYIGRHDRINNWDLVDRSAPHVVGGYLVDKPRKPLYALAKSKDPWRRRTAIVSTWFFIRKNDVKDTFALARQLVHDKHELVQKAVGSWLREAGKRDREQLIEFLDELAGKMNRTALRYSIEKLEKKVRNQYLRS